MKKREIPKRNYVYLSLLVIVVVGVCFYLASWYKTIDEYYKTNSVISEVLSEIETESFSSFLLDNPDITIYVSSSSDQGVKSFEKQMKKIILDYSLDNKVIYFNIDKDKEGLNVLTNNYMSKELKKVKEISDPNLIRFENGEITDILYIKDDTITKNDVLNFLKRNEVIEND